MQQGVFQKNLQDMKLSLKVKENGSNNKTEPNQDFIHEGLYFNVFRFTGHSVLDVVVI